MTSWWDDPLPEDLVHMEDCMIRTYDEEQSSLVKALNRYGHHDHDCDHHDVFDSATDCPCGFNQALRAALERKSCGSDR